MHADITPFLNKLRNGADLAASDAAELATVLGCARRVAAGTELVRQGDQRGRLILMLDGWACHSRVLASGSRQAISLLLPGDLCQPFGTTPSYMSDSLVTLTPASFCSVAATDLRELAKRNARLERAFWWDLQFSREIQNELIASLGRRNAVERLANLICEIHFRLAAIEGKSSLSFELPLTQIVLADLLGLSTVHMNRSFKTLRSQGLITTQGRRVTIADLRELTDFAGFEVAHLQLRLENLHLEAGYG